MSDNVITLQIRNTNGRVVSISCVEIVSIDGKPFESSGMDEGSIRDALTFLDGRITTIETLLQPTLCEADESVTVTHT